MNINYIQAISLAFIYALENIVHGSNIFYATQGFNGMSSTPPNIAIDAPTTGSMCAAKCMLSKCDFFLYDPNGTCLLGPPKPYKNIVWPKGILILQFKTFYQFMVPNMMVMDSSPALTSPPQAALDENCVQGFTSNASLSYLLIDLGGQFMIYQIAIYSGQDIFGIGGFNYYTVSLSVTAPDPLIEIAAPISFSGLTSASGNVQCLNNTVTSYTSITATIQPKPMTRYVLIQRNGSLDVGEFVANAYGYN